MSDPYYADERVTLHLGDCLDVLRGLPDASIDAAVLDPPYGLEFMGRDWDGADGFRRSLNPADAQLDSVFGRRSRTSPEYRAGHLFEEWCAAWATEAFRVLKPGGFLLAFGGTRTFHRLACGIEDAGFEIRDSIGYGHATPSVIAWAFGSGFPKSLNVSSALADLPACSCGNTRLGGESGGVVHPGGPSSAVGTGAGAEAGTVRPTGGPADLAFGVRPQVVPPGASLSRHEDVDALDKGFTGEPLPVVLGPSSVARDAEGEQVVGQVGGVKVDPEPLRDEVMGEQIASGPAVGAGTGALNDGVGDGGPLAALVSPSSAAPGGVLGSTESLPVGDGHAIPGAIDAGVCPSAELAPADSARVGAIPGASHRRKHTPERLARCEACGGRQGDIPPGLGTALKPAWEPIVVARKPIERTVAANVQAHGTGALNVDACRVPGALEGDPNRFAKTDGGAFNAFGDHAPIVRSEGRWPTNVVLSHAPLHGPDGDVIGDACTEGCVPGCAVAELDEQSGTLISGVPGGMKHGGSIASVSYADIGAGSPVTGFGDSGGASRFFPAFRYEAKAGSAERPSVDGIAHPTVKPVDLIRWLIRLVTPPGGTVADWFAGSGTTGEAAILEGFQCLLVEREPSYLPLILARVKPYTDQVTLARARGRDVRPPRRALGPELAEALFEFGESA